MNIIESIARQLCIDKSIDPDFETVGLGAVMPANEKYKLWEYQLPFVRRVIELYDVGCTTDDGDD